MAPAWVALAHAMPEYRLERFVAGTGRLLKVAACEIHPGRGHVMLDHRLVAEVVRLSPSGDRSFLIHPGEILTNSATARDRLVTLTDRCVVGVRRSDSGGLTPPRSLGFGTRRSLCRVSVGDFSEIDLVGDVAPRLAFRRREDRFMRGVSRSGRCLAGGISVAERLSYGHLERVPYDAPDDDLNHTYSQHWPHPPEGRELPETSVLTRYLFIHSCIYSRESIDASAVTEIVTA